MWGVVWVACASQHRCGPARAAEKEYSGGRSGWHVADGHMALVAVEVMAFAVCQFAGGRYVITMLVTGPKGSFGNGHCQRLAL